MRTLEQDQRAYTEQYQTIRNAVKHYLGGHAAARGYELRLQDKQDRVDDAMARTWVIFRDRRPKCGSDRRAAFQAARAAALRLGGRRVSPLGSERVKGMGDAMDRRIPDNSPLEHIAAGRREFCELPDLHFLPEKLRRTAIALASGDATQEEIAARLGITTRTLANHKRQIGILMLQHAAYAV